MIKLSIQVQQFGIKLQIFWNWLQLEFELSWHFFSEMFINIIKTKENEWTEDYSEYKIIKTKNLRDMIDQ